MDTADFFLKGLLIGFAIAAPVGPIGALCIRRTLIYGRLSGLVSGLGAACADSVFGIIAAFGLTFISDFLFSIQFWLRLLGGIFLLYLGWRTFFAKPPEIKGQVQTTGYLKDFISTFFLTLSNPMTILGFTAIFSAIGLVRDRSDYFFAGILVLGVFIGSACWWLILSEGITFFRKKMSEKMLKLINKLAGLIIFSFGIGILLNLK
jgi:threonine/homoserine/homoserine lactone efflux protein